MARDGRTVVAALAALLVLSGIASAQSLTCTDLDQGATVSQGPLTVSLASDLTLSGLTTNPATVAVAFFLMDCEATHTIVGQFPVILPVVDGSFSIGLASLGDVHTTLPIGDPGPTITNASLVGSGSFAVYVDPRDAESHSIDSFLVLLHFETSTSADAIHSLDQQVHALVSIGALNPGQGHALTATLGAALAQLDRGNQRPARNQLGAFLNQVAALVRAGVLSAAQADALVNPAQALVNALD